MARHSLFSTAVVTLAAFAAAGAYRAVSAPLPAGLQYDEINRIVLASATPPPPGSFDTDYAALQSSAAEPKKKHGGMFGSIMNIEQNARDAMSGLTNGRITRYSYYNNWERTDDIAGKTATIRKCDLHQIVELDLDKRTYRIVDTTPKPGPATSAAPAPPPHPGAPPENAAPGTATLDFTRVSKALGTMVIDGLSALHFTSTNTMSMTNATGSCKNGSYSVTQDQYISAYAQPHPICPVDFQQPPPAAAVPRDPSQMVARGGCRPTITTHVSGAPEPAGKLALYSLMTMAASSGGAQGPNGPPQGVSFLTERGNVRALGGADAGLFEIPSDFTKEP